MPLDPSIILSQNKLIDPLQAQLAVQNARNQQQQNQYALQAAQLGLQGQQIQVGEQQQQVADEKAARDLLHQKNDASDQEILSAAGPKVGGAIIASRQKAAEAKANIDKLSGEAKNYQAQIATKQQDYAGHLAQSVIDANYDTRAVQLAISQAHRDGFESQAQQLQQVLQTHPEQIPQVMQTLVSQSEAVQKQKAEQQKITGEAQGRAEAGRHNVATEAQAGATLDEAKIRDAQNAKQQALRTNIEMQRLGIDFSKLKMEQSKANASNAASSGAPLGGEAEKIAQSLASGDFDPKQLGRFKDKEAIVSRALTLNPGWNSGTYTGRQYYGNGNGKNVINNIAALEGHVDTLADASKNAGFSPMIEKSITPGQAAYNIPAQVVTHQLGNIMSNGHVTDEGTINRIQEGLISPFEGTREAARKSVNDVVKENVAAVFQNYKTSTGNAMNPEEYFDGPTLKRLEAKGYIPAESLALMKGKTASPASSSGTDQKIQDLRSKYKY